MIKEDMKKKTTILVVDDEEKNLRLMGAILKHYGYCLETAQDGREALNKAKEILPDLIFLDIMMPGMDGYETCKELRKDPATRFIPVVMVTALDDQESRNKGLEAGATEFLTKPVDKAELLIRTKNILKVKEFEDFLQR
jgi:putative two-component system response regulator